MPDPTDQPLRFCATCAPTATPCGRPCIEYGDWTEIATQEERHLTTYRCGEPAQEMVVVDLRFEADGVLELC